MRKLSQVINFKINIAHGKQWRNNNDVCTYTLFLPTYLYEFTIKIEVKQGEMLNPQGSRRKLDDRDRSERDVFNERC